MNSLAASHARRANPTVTAMMPMRAAATAALLLLALLALLSGCGGDDARQLHTWMREVDAQTRQAVPPLAAPKTFMPFVYAQQGQIDPFNPAKLSSELAKLNLRNAGGGLRPDVNRRKEFLENYPLDAMKLVGTLEKDGAIHALLQIERSVHLVVKGIAAGPPRRHSRRGDTRRLTWCLTRRLVRVHLSVTLSGIERG
jgi:type IV pilus assembly protein PilP